MSHTFTSVNLFLKETFCHYHKKKKMLSATKEDKLYYIHTIEYCVCVCSVKSDSLGPPRL